MPVDRELFNPGRRVNLFCGRPLIIFHDHDFAALEEFYDFQPPWERCTRIVLTEETIPHTCSSVIYVDHQSLLETAIWYASADCVVTHDHEAEALAAGSLCVFGEMLADALVRQLNDHGYV